jgi:biopolymer transport protein ExbD
MARKLEEINAGSMADIAFLLLIFFLVTTTMDSDEGIVRILPQATPPDWNPPPIPIHERDVFEINVNAQNLLLVEGEYIYMDQLEELTYDFLTNYNGKENLPAMITVNKQFCDSKIGEIRNTIATTQNMDPTTRKFWESEIKYWESKREAVEVAGEFRTLPKMAVISLRNDNGTSYDTYVQVQDCIQSAINRLRNEWCRKIYGKDFTELREDIADDQEKIKIIRAIVPQNIIERQPKNLGRY